MTRDVARGSAIFVVSFGPFPGGAELCHQGMLSLRINVFACVVLSDEIFVFVFLSKCSAKLQKTQTEVKRRYKTSISNLRFDPIIHLIFFSCYIYLGKENIFL